MSASWSVWKTIWARGTGGGSPWVEWRKVSGLGSGGGSRVTVSGTGGWVVVVVVGSGGGSRVTVSGTGGWVVVVVVVGGGGGWVVVVVGGGGGSGGGGGAGGGVGSAVAGPFADAGGADGLDPVDVAARRCDRVVGVAGGGAGVGLDDVEDAQCVGGAVAANDGVVGDGGVRRGRPGEGDLVVGRRDSEVVGLGRGVGAGGGRSGGHLLVLRRGGEGDDCDGQQRHSRDRQDAAPNRAVRTHETGSDGVAGAARSGRGCCLRHSQPPFVLSFFAPVWRTSG